MTSPAAGPVAASAGTPAMPTGGMNAIMSLLP
jgi:hypothetical protein